MKSKRRTVTKRSSLLLQVYHCTVVMTSIGHCVLVQNEWLPEKVQSNSIDVGITIRINASSNSQLTVFCRTSVGRFAVLMVAPKMDTAKEQSGDVYLLARHEWTLDCQRLVKTPSQWQRYLGNQLQLSKLSERRSTPMNLKHSTRSYEALRLTCIWTNLIQQAIVSNTSYLLIFELWSWRTNEK